MKEEDGDVSILDKVYFCRECSAVYLFSTDLDEHHISTGHSGRYEMPFELKT